MATIFTRAGAAIGRLTTRIFGAAGASPAIEVEAPTTAPAAPAVAAAPRLTDILPAEKIAAIAEKAAADVVARSATLSAPATGGDPLPPYLRGEDEHALRQGCRLLKEMLPRARALARKPSVAQRLAETYVSQVGRSLIPHMRLDNVAGTVVFEENGGWYYDVLFKEVDSGIGNTIGNYPNDPVPSRAKAVEAVQSILTFIAGVELGFTDLISPKGPTFHLEGLEFEFDAGVVAVAVASWLLDFDIEFWRTRLNEMLTRDFGAGVPDVASFNGMVPAVWTDYETCFLGLLTKGVFSHDRPGHEPKDAAPTPQAA